MDADTYKVKRVIHAGNDPEQLAISADGKRLYIANEDAAQVSVVDVPSGTIIATVKMGEEPEGVTIRPDGKVVYVTSEDEGAVYAIDTPTNKVVKRVEVGLGRARSGSSPTARALCLARERWRDRGRGRAGPQVPAADSARRQGATPEAAADGDCRYPDGSTVYVTAGSFGHLFLVDPVKNAPTRQSKPVSGRGASRSPDGKTIVTANGPSNDVSLIDLATPQAVKKINAGKRPWGVAVLGGDREPGRAHGHWSQVTWSVLSPRSLMVHGLRPRSTETTDNGRTKDQRRKAQAD